MTLYIAPDSFLRPVDAGQIFHPSVFPEIDRLDDILPHLRIGEGIRLFDHDRFLVLRYTSAIPGTFRSAMDLEARSLIFEKATGLLLSRPFHKFFNLGERAGLDDIDFASGAGRLEEKLDGSMIAGFIHDGNVMFHTRGGVSRQAMEALAAAEPGHLALTREAFEAGYTPVFEWVSPANRVIIAYERPALVLITLRHRRSGQYDRSLARALAGRHGVQMPAVLAEDIASVDALVAAHAELVDRDDIEGAVLVMPNGLHLKMKARDYLRRHKILANLSNERYAYQAWIDQVVDDTAAALGGTRGQVLSDFATELEGAIRREADGFIATAATITETDGRRRAEIVRKLEADKLRQAALFAALRGEDPTDTIRIGLENKIASPASRQAIKAAFGLPDWRDDIEDIN